MICDGVKAGALIHVEVALEDPLLHGIGNLGLLGHLTRGRLHDGDTLGALVNVAIGTEQTTRRARDGAPLGSGTEVLSEIVTLACGRRC